jgi:hypothetical protein
VVGEAEHAALQGGVGGAPAPGEGEEAGPWEGTAACAARKAGSWRMAA